jgi:sugar phosphate isomerase/epimerase
MTPIGYCANVHPGRNLSQLRESLRGAMARVAARVSLPSLPVSLWLAAETIRELTADPALATRLRDEARDLGIAFVAVNAFPYGNFHAGRVKRAVYHPDWSDGRRAHYTLAVAELLPRLLPPGARRASISTLPLGWRPSFSASGGGAAVGVASAALEQIASRLRDIERDAGVRITLDIEPEPGCAIQTSEELVGFFEHCLPRETRSGAPLRRHLGACVDVCHGAVMGERPQEFFERCAAAEIAINRVQLSSAIRGGFTPRDLDALARFDEPRYLHQVATGRGAARRQWDDIPDFLAAARTAPPTRDGAAAPADDEWRCHWHVPIHLRRVDALATTADAIDAALQAALRLPDAPQIEVETYAWSQLPGLESVAPDFEEGVAAEIRYAHARAAACSHP